MPQAIYTDRGGVYKVNNDNNEVTNMQQANEYLEKIYIKNHNQKYSVSPRNSFDLHKPINAKLEDIFVRSSQRRAGNDWTISYNSKLLQLDNSRPAIVKPKDIVTVNERFDCSLFITIRKEFVDFKEIKIKPQKQEPLIQANPSFYQYKPPVSHPWRRFNSASQRKGDISKLL